MALSPQWLDELRARTTLSTLVGRTAKLTRAGREWKACCPFHNEKTPSFYVNDEKGFYHCFGCQAHGDAIRWLTDQQGLPFMDAVKELAAAAGMEVPAPDPRAAKAAEERAGLHDVTAAAQDWFRRNLSQSAGADARAYLSRRGIDEATAKEFGFGYAPDDRQGIKQALGQFDDTMLDEAGLRGTSEKGESYDRFRGRLMLPIQDARGRVIAFGGRILDDGIKGAPKYLNSPETPLFDKGSTLYNLHRAGPASRQSGRILVAEGYMDVIALAAAGLPEAVAPLGTALTERQIERLWRLVDRPILCFDGDAAGRRAAMRAATRALPLLRPGHSLSFVTLPQGKDPDDVVRAGGKEAMERLIEARQSLLDLVWEHERATEPLDGPEAKAGLKARLLAHVDAIEHSDIKALYRREWLERFSTFAFPPRPPGPPRQPFQRRSGGWQGSSWQGGDRPQPMKPEMARRIEAALTGSRDQLARAVIAGFVRHPQLLATHAEALARYDAPDAATRGAMAALAEISESLEFEGDAPIKELERLATPPDNNRYSFLVEGHDPQSIAEDLADAVALLVDRPAIVAALQAASQRFEQTLEDADFAEQRRLVARLQEFDEAINRRSRQRAAGPDEDTQMMADGVPSPAENELD